MLLAVARLLAIPGDPETMQTLRQGRTIVERLPDDNPRLLGGRVLGTVDAPVERVWAVVNDYAHYPDFMPNHKTTWIISPEAVAELDPGADLNRAQFEAFLEPYQMAAAEGDTVYLYAVLDLPFPVGKRWYLLEMTLDSETHEITWHRVYGNLRSVSGSWQLEPFDEGTIATYTTRSDVGIRVPGFLVSLGLNQTLPDVIHALRRRAAE